jgi:hypothetical protein
MNTKFWHDASIEVPENPNMVLGAWIVFFGDVAMWDYAVVKYNRYNQKEWMKDTEVIQVQYWKFIEPPEIKCVLKGEE